MIERVFPAWDWLRGYRRCDLAGDLVAGLVVAVMLVPQGLAYAMLAGLPPVVGLYASTVPLLAYALFGSSRQLAVGPVAMISLVVVAKCSAIVPEVGSPGYIRVVLLLCLMVGAIQAALGLLRMGFLVNFLSHAVISGFTSAAAILIGLSQLKHLLGIEVRSQHSAFGLLRETARGIGGTHAVTLAIGVGSLAALVALRKLWPRLPSPIAVVVAATLLAWLLRLDAQGVRTVGHVPSGFPALSLPEWSGRDIGLLLPAAFTIVFVGFLESISIAQVIATRERQRVDASRELVALGMANLAAAFFSGYPVTGGLSRTAVNYQAGARTGLASIVTAALVLLTLLVLTPLFHFLPHAVLGAIVLVAVAGLVDLRTPRRLFAVKPSDGWMLVATFVGTLALGVESGVLLGVALSLGLFIWRSAHPHTAELGYLAEHGVFRNIKRFPEAKTVPEALLVRVDASLYFANMSFLEDWLRRHLHERPAVRWVIMDMSGVNDMDAVAIETLERLMKGWREHGVEFAFASMKGPVRDLVARAGWPERCGKRIGYVSIEQALRELCPGGLESSAS
ncbi:MAG TPA: solute carrier family 26 protein [Planctomycetota bacterium]|nr:solute carrier family 26 protein [Planctomycetota bacterium]HRR79384.1 solute carrier family 26 protein [Planctomycetota bacterium]HRT93717.1 solute carrier family 26 protein [Planctomycetota bacterium]